MCAACGSSDQPGGKPEGGNANDGTTSSAAAISRACTVNTASVNACVEYTGAGFTQEAIQAACAEAQGVYYTPFACKTDDLAGSCAAMVNADPDYEVTYYYGSAMSLDDASAWCTTVGGSFAAGTKAACTDSPGVTVLDGSSEARERYAASVGLGDVACQSETQTRVCSNGAWGPWSGTYQAEQCTSDIPCVGTPDPCDFMITPVSCGAQHGCEWSTGHCSGTPTAECSSLFLYRDGCDGQAGCWIFPY